MNELEISCKNKKIKLNKILVCSKIAGKGTKIFYGKIKELKKKKISAPFCFIIPGKMHFIEKEVVEGFGVWNINV